MRYQVLVEVEADDEDGALFQAVYGDVIPVTVRQEPFDEPSPMWQAVKIERQVRLVRRLR
jgi:hypothetical protein